jgi:hypothetical protein
LTVYGIFLPQRVSIKFLCDTIVSHVYLNNLNRWEAVPFNQIRNTLVIAAVTYVMLSQAHCLRGGPFDNELLLSDLPGTMPGHPPHPI